MEGELKRLIGSWLVGVKAGGNGRVTLQTLSPCMDCELCLFARDTQAEVPLVSPEGAKVWAFQYVLRVM